jgi:hypothetical protein
MLTGCAIFNRHKPIRTLPVTVQMHGYVFAGLKMTAGTAKCETDATGFALCMVPLGTRYLHVETPPGYKHFWDLALWLMPGKSEDLVIVLRKEE